MLSIGTATHRSNEGILRVAFPRQTILTLAMVEQLQIQLPRKVGNSALKRPCVENAYGKLHELSRNFDFS